MVFQDLLARHFLISQWFPRHHRPILTRILMEQLYCYLRLEHRHDAYAKEKKRISATGHTCISERSIELVPCFGRLDGRRASSTGETGRRLICDAFGGCSSGMAAMWPLGGASLCSLPAEDPDSGIETELSSLDLDEPARRPPSTLHALSLFTFICHHHVPQATNSTDTSQ